MMKKLVLGLVIYCGVSGVMAADVDGMNEANSRYEPMTKKQKLMIYGGNPSCNQSSINFDAVAESPISIGMGSDSDSSALEMNGKWIQDHFDLINKAKYDGASFDELLNKIIGSFASEEDRRSIYESIESGWNGKNLFEAEVLDGIFYSYRKDWY